MDSQFDKLIKKDKYQVFLFVCPCTFPLSFASHPWFVINKKGVISRYGVNHLKKSSEKSYGHLAINFLPPFKGLEKIPFVSRFNFKATLMGFIEGGEESEAKKVLDFIEKSPLNYPHLNVYHFIGPNSNTYAEWILKNSPVFKVKLPWNSFGKNYKK